MKNCAVFVVEKECDECTEHYHLSADDLNAILLDMYRLSCCRSIRGLAASIRVSFYVCQVWPRVREKIRSLEYTEKWVCAVDRGGLFHVSDEVFIFFCELETKVRVFLQKLVNKSLGNKKQEILDEIVNDGDIQFYWSTLCTDLDLSESEVLLFEISQLWLTIRGFSTASACVEQYKKLTKEGTKKSAGLRKTLKKSLSDE